MIEIVFSDSAAGSLKMAQYHEPSTSGPGAVSDIAINRSGSPIDVFGFHLLLSIGELSESLPGAKRQAVLDGLWSHYPETVPAAELIQQAAENLELILTRIAGGEPYRVWVGQQPDEQAGLFWLMYQLQRAEITSESGGIIELPGWVVSPQGHLFSYANTAEIPAEDWHRLISFERPLPQVFQQTAAACWQQLIEENAPLRAVISGEIVSVAADFYDPFILRLIDRMPEVFHEARFIGTFLGEYPFGVSDSWLATRIDELILTGRLEPIDKAPSNLPKYHRRLRKLPL